MQTIYKLPPNTRIHTIKVSPRKHIKCVKIGDNYYYEIHILDSIKLLSNMSNSVILKIFKDLAITVLPITLSKESIDTIFAFSSIDETDIDLKNATIKLNVDAEINYKTKQTEECYVKNSMGNLDFEDCIYWKDNPTGCLHCNKTIKTK